MKVLVLLTCLTLALTALSVTAPHRTAASTCSMIDLPDPFDRINSAFESSEVIALGMVMGERLVTSNDGFDEGYESTVNVVGVLKGDLTDSQLTIPRLGDNCPGGGTRLHPGEHVLLMLWHTCYAYRSGVPEDCHWALSSLGGKILLQPGQAILEDIDYKPVSVGVPEQFIRDIGARAGATNAQIEQALQAAAIPPAESSRTLAVIIAAAFSGLLALLVGTRLLLKRRQGKESR
ncbi:MAG TPA: hypothetical protein VI876_13445 [Dehalococcoidia bacterium]|nr:hypothetical protein [Dehalococcoidia bacterium]